MGKKNDKKHGKNNNEFGFDKLITKVMKGICPELSETLDKRLAEQKANSKLDRQIKAEQAVIAKAARKVSRHEKMTDVDTQVVAEAVNTELTNLGIQMSTPDIKDLMEKFAATNLATKKADGVVKSVVQPKPHPSAPPPSA